MRMRKREFETLNDAFCQTVHRSEKSIAVIAEEIGMTANYLYKACMPDSDMDERAAGVRFPTKKVLPLMRATGDFSVLRYMANATNHAVVSIPDITNKSCSDIQHHAIRAASEFGDLMAKALTVGVMILGTITSFFGKCMVLTWWSGGVACPRKRTMSTNIFAG